MSDAKPSPKPTIDVTEHGAPRDGAAVSMDRRLFMQLLVLRCEGDASPRQVVDALASGLGSGALGGVVYEDVNDPEQVGLLTWSEEPAHFVEQVRPLVAGLRSVGVRTNPSMTMLGRSYSTGYERDLEHTLLLRPIVNATTAAWPWAVWYPLRRRGSFEKLSREEKGSILGEHARIGMAYGQADLAHDIRLACHGLDANDNEFVVGLVGANLHRLSHVVQSMRGTRQTSEYIERMGPFFVGHAVWQSAPPRS